MSGRLVVEGVEGTLSELVHRYNCPRCRCTWSVIPQEMMPHRRVEMEHFEEMADAQLGSASEGARPPPATEKEEGCIRRAVKKLSERIPLLCGLLGQQMPAPVGMDIGSFWRALRELARQVKPLLRLARDFKTSLLRCYRSLLPHWERKKAHAGLV